MAKKKPITWKEHHESLVETEKEKAALIRQNIMQSCEWSQDTFYRKMRAPQKLKFYEKQIIVLAYNFKRVTDLFVETKKLPAIPL